MKILYITTIGRTMAFFKDFIRQLLDEGNIVDIATNENEGSSMVPECYREWGCKVYSISCSRSPHKKGNIKAIQQIKHIVKENRYELVHCHTPIAAMCTRLACRSFRDDGLKVFYTAHGFHFYDGAPLINWLLYYPVEKICSYMTDVLITINKEDYERAKKNFYAKKTVYIPGVGIDTKKFAPRASSRERIREELGLNDSELILLSVGELNENKNHEAVIRAIKGMKVIYVIVGKGEKKVALESTAEECGVDLRLTGYRDDVADFYDAADIYILPSIREGLNVSLMEAMASGMACVCSRIRGNTDLIEDKRCLFDPVNQDEIQLAIGTAIGSREKLGRKNLEKIRKFDISTIANMVAEIYQESIGT